MSDIVTSAGVPEVAIGSGSPASSAGATATFSGKWEDMAKDMASIAQEMSPQEQPAQPDNGQPNPAVVTNPEVKSPAAVVPQAQTANNQPPAPQAEDVPEKFRDANGKLDQEKLIKSYFEAEKALKRAQNAAQTPAAPQVAQPVQSQPQSQPVATPQGLTPFEARVAQDLLNEAAALGYQMPQAQAIAQARIQIRLLDAKHQADTAATFAEVAQFRETLAQQAQRTELESLAKNPDTNWVLTPKGQSDLMKVREENPWINASPTPWASAAYHLLGQRRISEKSSGGLVNMPNPTGAQNAAPPLPVTPTPPASNPIQLNTPQQIEAHVKTLTPQQEAEFWRKAGMKWDTPKSFVGI